MVDSSCIVCWYYHLKSKMLNMFIIEEHWLDLVTIQYSLLNVKKMVCYCEGF